MMQWIEGGRARRIAAGYLGLLFIALLGYGWATDWFPWSRECYETLSCHMLPGETFAALEQVWGNLHFGLRKSWLLLMHHNVDRYLFYIHNQNFGAYVIYLTARLGAETLMPAVVVTAAGFVIGHGYGYLLVERLSRSSFMALTFLTFLILDVYSNTMLGLNPLRSWHWLALFGVAYHALDLFEAPRVRKRHIATLFLLAFIGFALGYEFYAFVVSTAFLAVVLSGYVRPSRRWVLFGALLILPFLLRQVQVAGGVGLTVWALDLYYTAGTKSPFLRNLLPQPPVEVVLQWYKDHELWHGVPNQQPISAAVARFIAEDRYIFWLDGFGNLTVAAALLGFVLASVVLVLRWRSAEGGYARAAITIAGGQLLGFLLFGYHALLYFVVQFSMPLIVTSVYVLIAFLLTLLLRGERSPLVRGLGILIGIVLLGERLLVGWRHVSTMEIGARPNYPPYMHIVIDTIAPPGGALGSAGWVTLTIAALFGVWVLWKLWTAFLTRGLDQSAPSMPSAPAPSMPAVPARSMR